MNENVLMPEPPSNKIQKRHCQDLMRVGQGPLFGWAICPNCGAREKLDIQDAKPESHLTSHETMSFLVQTEKGKKGEWDDDLPAGARIVDEWDLSQQ